MPAVLNANRQIAVEIDPTDTVQVEPFFAKARMRFEIRNPILTNVEQLASGVWILKPRETNLFTLHETTSGQSSIMRLSDFNTNAAVQEIPVQRIFSDLPGVTPSVLVSPTGDHFHVKRIPAGGSFNIMVSEIRPRPTLPTTPNYEIPVVAQQNTGLDPPDQGYILRWMMPAHMQEYVDYVMSFKFGGEITAGGYGEFELFFGGDGRAYLFEWIADAWSMVDEWRYAPFEMVPGHAHTVRIIPHALRYIEIRTNITDKTQPGFLFQNNRMNEFSGQSIKLDAHVYETKNRDNLPAPPGGLGYNVTGAGQVHFRVREDMLLRWQPARITYPASGTLRDQAFTVPFVDTSTHVLAVRAFSTVLYNPLSMAPHGSVSANAYNASTGAALTPASENWTFGSKTLLLNGFTLPGRPNAIQVELTLTNNDGAGGPWSPWVYGYEAYKIGTNAANTVTGLTIDETHFRQSPAERLSITGPDADPSHESARLVVRDLVNRASRLNTRGAGRIKITTTYDSLDQSKKAILFDGYFIKSDGAQRGSTGRTFPNPSWTDYSLICMGMWVRLHERDYLATEILNFSVDIDPSVAPEIGESRPSKVTDAIRYLMVAAGIPESQLDIPDLEIRLWANQTEGGDTILVQPGTNCAEFVRHLAEDYLNYFLCFDGNAGSSGMWRLKPVPRGTESAVWTFTDEPPLPGRIATAAGAYPAATTFIARDTLTEWTVPPEGNYLRVTGTRKNGFVYKLEQDNPKAFNRPGASTADPTHPDYTDGRYRPIFRRHDEGLLTKEALQFVLRRVFDLSCRAQRFARFQCPMPLIDAAAEEPLIYTTRTHRPLMFGDVVTYRGDKCMVRSCNLNARKSWHQIATIELVRFNDPL